MDAVLVVDDEQPMRWLLERWLKGSGYHARVAASADEALDVFEGRPPAVAICDLIMPGHDGVWLTRQLRMRYPDTALIIATGAPNPAALGELPNDIVEYLFKPFSRDRLTHAVQRGLSWHRASGARRWNDRLGRQQWERSRELREWWHSAHIDSYDTLMDALKVMLSDDADALEHAIRVSKLAAVACRELGLSREETEDVQHAALLHDLGKLGLPDALLAKPAPLSPEERDLIRRHPEIAYECVKDHHMLGRIADLVRAATEWYGGGGYPAGLEGETIPLGSRIIAVADAYDAMTHSRAYRDPVTPSEAVFELLRCRGSQFDPDVVRAFLDGVTAH